MKRKEKQQYSILTYIRNFEMITLYARQEKETQMYRTDFCTLWEKVRVRCFERTACILSIVK